MDTSYNLSRSTLNGNVHNGQRRHNGLTYREKGHFKQNFEYTHKDHKVQPLCGAI